MAQNVRGFVDSVAIETQALRKVLTRMCNFAMKSTFMCLKEVWAMVQAIQ